MFESTIPEPINLTIDQTRWTFPVWVQYVCDTSPVFAASRANGRAADRLVNAVMGKDAGEPYSWIDDDQKLFDEAVEKPSRGWCPPVFGSGDQPLDVPARMFNRYFDAASKPDTAPANGTTAAAQPATEATASA